MRGTIGWGRAGCRGRRIGIGFMRLIKSVAQWLLPLGLLLFGCTANVAPPPQVSGYRTHAPLADTTNIIFVLPVTGIEGTARLVLADALAASLRDAARPAVISEIPNTQGPTIYGNVSEIRRRGTIAWATANWELRTPTGETVAHVSHEVVVDGLLWAAAGVEAVNLIIAEAEPLIIGMVADHVGPLTSTQDVAMPPMERMPVVSGSSQSVEQIGQMRPPTVPGARTTLRPPATAPSASPENGAMPPADMADIVDGANAADIAKMDTTLPPGLNSLTEEDMAVPPSEPVAAQPKPKAPVRLIPRGDAEVSEDAGEVAIEEVSRLDSMTNDNAPAIEDVQAKALTDGLLEMADLPKEDSVPDNTKLKPVVWENPSFLVRIVSGAPGDGNESLTSSLKAALRDKDMTVTEDPRQAEYEIKGRVVVGPPVNGRQQARIVWRVNTVGGEEVGQAVQENAVIAGSLEGEWGRVAKFVSDAAVNGIQELFDDKGRQRSRSQAAPKFPDVPSLPQVPGRAPPPVQ